MLLADEKGASLIVAVGTHATLVEFLDKGRGGMASTFLTRLKVGGKLVDAKGVSRLYRQSISGSSLLLLVLSAIAAMAAAVAVSTVGKAYLARGRRVVGQSGLPAADSSSSRATTKRLSGVINFRYHVVSLTAVFLALAIGLVVGTAALNGPVADTLRNQVTRCARTTASCATQVSQTWTSRLNREEEFATEAAPDPAGRQAHQPPGPAASPCRPAATTPTGSRAMLVTAGATVTGTVDRAGQVLRPAERRASCSTWPTQAAAADVPTTGLPRNSDGVETSSALLAAALLDQAGRPPQVAPADLTAVLTAYTKAGYIGYDDAGKDTVTGPAEAVVVVCGLPSTDQDAAKKNEAAVTMVSQFDRTGAAGGRRQRRRRRQPGRRGPRRPDAGQDASPRSTTPAPRRARWPPRWPCASSWCRTRSASTAWAPAPTSLVPKHPRDPRRPPRRSWTMSANCRSGGCPDRRHRVSACGSCSPPRPGRTPPGPR